MPSYLTAAALIYTGGLIYGALINAKSHKVFPLTPSERHGLLVAVLCWPVYLPVALLLEDD